MTVQLSSCAYQTHVNNRKNKKFCDENLAVLTDCGFNRFIQKIIAGYVVEVSCCISCRQVKQGGVRAIRTAMAFFKENILRNYPHELSMIGAKLQTECPNCVPVTVITRVFNPSDVFALLITNSWRYSLYNLYPATYDTLTMTRPTDAFEARMCFHLLTAQCISQSTCGFDLPDVTLDERDQVEEAMCKERDAVTKEIVEASRHY